jgi:hypothetical protein
MGIKIYPRLSPRLILVDTDTISVQNLHNFIREWEDEPWNMQYPKLIDSSGKEDLGDEVSVGITSTLKNAQVGFESQISITSEGSVTTGDTEGTRLIDSGATFITDVVNPGDIIQNLTDGSDATVLEVILETELVCLKLQGGSDNQFDVSDAYQISPIIQCKISGGNLVAVDDAGSSMSAVFTTAKTQIVRTSASSATLQELEAIQQGAFDNCVTIDVVSGSSGTAYPLGTHEYPVNNLDDAKTIAQARGLIKLHIDGTLTLQSGDDVSGYTLFSTSTGQGEVVAQAGCVTSGTGFEMITVSGALNGVCSFFRCVISSITNFQGEAKESLIGTAVLASGGAVYITYCFGIGTVLDFNSIACDLYVLAFNGMITLKNKTQSDAAHLGFISGSITLEDTVTAGTITIQGACQITNSSSADVDAGDSMAATAVALSGSTEYAVKTNLGQANGFFNGMLIQIQNTAGIAVRKISQYDATGGTCHVNDPFPFVPANGDMVLILARYVSSARTGIS